MLHQALNLPVIHLTSLMPPPHVFLPSSYKETKTMPLLFINWHAITFLPLPPSLSPFPPSSLSSPQPHSSLHSQSAVSSFLPTVLRPQVSAARGGEGESMVREGQGGGRSGSARVREGGNQYKLKLYACISFYIVNKCLLIPINNHKKNHGSFFPHIWPLMTTSYIYHSV